MTLTTATAAGNGVGSLAIMGSLIGMVSGPIGLALGVLNYLRDRSDVKVTLHWNFKELGKPEVRGLVRVTNTGRRAVFITGAAVVVPNGLTYILIDSISGTKLAEGDRPMAYFVSHEGMRQHAAVWRKMRAYVETSAGKKYWSPRPGKSDEAPKWAQQ